MDLRTARDLAAVVRRQRRAAGWSQARLAEETGTSRDWVIQFEKAKSTVELGLALRALKALGLSLRLAEPPPDHAPRKRKKP